MHHPLRPFLLAALALAVLARPSLAQPRAAPPLGTFVLVDGYGNQHYRTFLPGGLVYAGVPAGGPDAFGVAQARAGDARELGSYTLRDGALIIVWGGGQRPDTTAFARKGTDVTLNGATYRSLRAYPRDHRLDGEYTTRAYNTLGVAGGGTMTWGGSSTVVFRADGTFDYGRAGMATTTAGTAAAAASSTPRQSGRYAVAGNTVTFTFADGTVQRALIHPWPGEESQRAPTSLNLNGRTYTRR